MLWTECVIRFDQAFENTLKSWEDKQKYDSCKSVIRSPLYPQQAVELATEEEVTQVQLCSQAAEELITRYNRIRKLNLAIYIPRLNHSCKCMCRLRGVYFIITVYFLRLNLFVYVIGQNYQSWENWLSEGVVDTETWKASLRRDFWLKHLMLIKSKNVFTGKKKTLEIYNRS